MYIIQGGAWQLPKFSCCVSWRDKRLLDLKNFFGDFRLSLDARYVKEKEEAAEKEIKMKEEE